jgi:S-formylglutathione hydrolase FrmB
MEIVSENKSHGGRQLVVKHPSSATNTDMTFSIFLPPQAEGGVKVPVLWYLSGLTCTHANVTEKGEYRAACAAHGIAFVAPDTSPRGPEVPDDPEGLWDFGQGAGFTSTRPRSHGPGTSTCGPMWRMSFPHWSRRTSRSTPLGRRSWAIRWAGMAH